MGGTTCWWVSVGVGVRFTQLARGRLQLAAMVACVGGHNVLVGVG